MTVDQCSDEDTFFTKSNFEIENPDSKWEFVFTTKKFTACFSACRSRSECQSATFLQENQQCHLKDSTRFHPQTKMKISPDAQLFEKNDCSLLFENQKQKKFIKVVPDATDCLDIYEQGWKIDGVYGVEAGGDFYRPILCRMSLYGGGWTVFQNRFDGSLPFNQTWKSYKNMTGNPLLAHLLIGKYLI